MHKKIRSHDANVGLLYGISVVLALSVQLEWIYLALAVAVLQIISPVTRFCSVYFILNKLMPASDPIQDGRRVN